MQKKSHFKTLDCACSDGVARITLNRPAVHNVFNDVMLDDLVRTFGNIASEKNIRVIVLAGAGKSFCAGADLNWMKKTQALSYEETIEDSKKIARVMEAIYEAPQPVILRAHGVVLGGGMGFVAAADIVVAAEETKFSFSEVKVGVVPACISPYVLRKTGERACRELFLTGERISAERALQFGLINYCVPEAKLDAKVDELASHILTSAPESVAVAKELIRNVSDMTMDEARAYTPEVIAGRRKSAEGQEGMQAFLEKRKPSWVK